VSGTTTLCPLDESTPLVPEVLVTSGEAFYGLPDPVDPGPGDPGVPLPTVSPRAFGRRIQVLPCKPVFHTPFGELRTARVESWSDRFGPGDAEFSIDTHDPGLRLFASSVTTVRGRNVVDPRPEGLRVRHRPRRLPRVDGHRAGTHRLGQGAHDSLDLVSPEALFDERTLGETEQHDYYEGRGAFPTDSICRAGRSTPTSPTRSRHDEPVRGRTVAARRSRRRRWVRARAVGDDARPGRPSPAIRVGSALVKAPKAHARVGLHRGDSWRTARSCTSRLHEGEPRPDRRRRHWLARPGCRPRSA
jgi:hypothetical protein